MTPRCSTVGEHDPSFLTVGQATKLALPWGSPLGPVHMREASLTRDPGLEFWGGYPRAPPGLLSPGLPGLELHVLFPNLASTNQESSLERMQDNKHLLWRLSWPSKGPAPVTPATYCHLSEE